MTRPYCPSCFGTGHIYRPVAGENPTGQLQQQPCPRGCSS